LAQRQRLRQDWKKAVEFRKGRGNDPSPLAEESGGIGLAK